MIDYDKCKELLNDGGAVCVNVEENNDKLYLNYSKIKIANALRAAVWGPASSSNTNLSTQGFVLTDRNYPLKWRPLTNKIQTEAEERGLQTMCAFAITKELQASLLECTLIAGFFGDAVVVTKL